MLFDLKPWEMCLKGKSNLLKKKNDDDDILLCIQKHIIALTYEYGCARIDGGGVMVLSPPREPSRTQQQRVDQK